MMRVSFFCVMLLAGCGGMEESGACPNDLPASCPPSPPGYAADIAPVIQARCGPCHTPGAQAGDKPLITYADVYARRSAVLNQLHACKMPPAGATPPTPAERAALLDWLVCGAPDN